MSKPRLDRRSLESRAEKLGFRLEVTRSMDGPGRRIFDYELIDVEGLGQVRWRNRIRREAACGVHDYLKVIEYFERMNP